MLKGRQHSCYYLDTQEQDTNHTGKQGLPQFVSDSMPAANLLLSCAASIPHARSEEPRRYAAASTAIAGAASMSMSPLWRHSAAWSHCSAGLVEVPPTYS